MGNEEIALLVALLALLVVVPALVAVLVLALAVRSYERLYRLVQALLVGLISEVDLPTAGEMLVREATELPATGPERHTAPTAVGSEDDISPHSWK